MSVQKKHKTKGRRNSRRKANYKISLGKTLNCPKCGKPQLPHRACPNCGYYKGREIVDVLKRKRKTAAKSKK